MPLEQTVTIVSNSGKIIKSGKQLFSIFKEAKGAYDDKKAELRSGRRAQTADAGRSVVGARRLGDYYRHEEGRRERGRYDDGYDDGRSKYERDDGRSRHERDDARSKYEYDDLEDAYRRHRRRHHPPHPPRPALTESNLKALSEVSGVTPSVPRGGGVPPAWDPATPVGPQQQQQQPPPRRFSEPAAGYGHGYGYGYDDDDGIDMDLAYGNIPPDLADRADLDPRREDAGQRARRLVGRVEDLLDEAHCLQHSAGAIIGRLQERPDAAAEVALTLAELSSAVANVSPALLGLLRGGSPAVFALLASPQFLIGTTIAVGVTVVMFGGWKIVKRIHEAPSALPATTPPQSAVPAEAAGAGAGRGDDEDAAARVDEALLVDDQLGIIETWRRGIMPLDGGDESADVELITPEARRAAGDKHAKDDADLEAYRRARSHRAASRRGDRPADRAGTEKARSEKPRSEKPRSEKARSEKARSEKARSVKARSVKTIEGGGGEKDALDLVFRAKPRHGDNMLKAIFRNKEKDGSSGGGGSSGGSRRRELVLA